MNILGSQVHLGCVNIRVCYCHYCLRLTSRHLNIIKVKLLIDYLRKHNMQCEIKSRIKPYRLNIEIISYLLIVSQGFS